MITAAIIGASGYSGAETLRLLLGRDDVTIGPLVAASSAGLRVDAVAPQFAGRLDGRFEEFDPSRMAGVDVAFVALPSGEGMKMVPRLRGAVKKIIDLGGDFRLQSPALYEQYYKHPHTAPELLPLAVYGMPEISRDAIRAADLVANPGCYTTASILGLLPALSLGLVQPAGIAIDAMSGISGAGRSASVDMSFSELNENVRAYKVGNHQHIPEIETVLSTASGKNVVVSFVPHLVPITRGIFATIHATLARGISTAAVRDAYREFFAGAPFVRVVEGIPSIKNVQYTNYCDIGVVAEERTNQLIVMSAIDNLVKGAAGQALQNMNLMFGIAEEKGLK